jgi:hypothetical protein
MKIWTRQHKKQPPIKTTVREDGFGSYAGVDGSSSINGKHFGSPERAREELDALVANSDLSHDCVKSECGEWQEFGSTPPNSITD